MSPLTQPIRCIHLLGGLNRQASPCAPTSILNIFFIYLCHKLYSLRPKIIVLIPRFLSQNNCPILCPTGNGGSKSNIFTPNLLYQEVFQHGNFGGHFVVIVISYIKSHTYNYSVNNHRTLISPKLETQTIILRGST